MTLQKWEDYDLKDFTLGTKRDQSSQFLESKVFDGPFSREDLTTDVVTTWSCSVTLNKREAQRFRNFIYQISGASAFYFSKKIMTEQGQRDLQVRIISGIPQANQVASNAWRFSFVIQAFDYETITPNDPNTIDRDSTYVHTPNVWEPMLRGLSTGATDEDFLTICASRASSTLFAGGNQGKASMSFNNGSTWSPVPAATGGGDSSKAVQASAISDDGKIVIACMQDGYVSRTINAGITWTPLERGFVFGAPTFKEGLDVSMSDDGARVFVAAVEVFVSYNGGTSFISVALPKTDDVFVRSIASNKTGALVLAVGAYAAGGIYAAISIDAGETWAEITPQIASNISGDILIKAAVSDSGGDIAVLSSTGFIAFSKNYGSTFNAATGNQITDPDSVGLPISISMSREGERLVYTTWIGAAISALDNYSVFGKLADLNPGAPRGEVFTRAIANNNIGWYAVHEQGFASRSVTPPQDVISCAPPSAAVPDVFTQLDLRAGLPASAGSIFSSSAIAPLACAGDDVIIFFGMALGNISKSIDNGSTFSQMQQDLGTSVSTFITNINTSTSGETVIASTASRLAVSNDGGNVFTDITSRYLSYFISEYEITTVSADPVCQNIFLTLEGSAANDEQGLGLLSKDYGFTFEELESGFSASIDVAVATLISNDGNGLFVLGVEGRAAYSNDGGYSFTQTTQRQNSGATSSSAPKGLAVSDDFEIMIAYYENGYAAKSINGGVSWSALQRGLGNSNSAATINGLAISGDGLVIVAVFDSGVHTTSIDGGSSWYQSTSILPSSGSPENLTSIVTNNARWYITTNQGKLFIGEEDLIAGP